MISYRAFLAGGVAAGVVCAAGQVSAQTRDFNVPTQAAVTAVPEFARQARVQVVASARDLQGVRTQPVVGEMTAMVLRLVGSSSACERWPSTSNRPLHNVG